MAKIPPRYREILDILREEICSGYGDSLAALAVFGSLARGVATPDSDIDLLIVARNLPRGRMERARHFASMEKGMLARHPQLASIELSPIFKTAEELALGSPLLWDMTDDVIPLYDREGILRSTLDRVRRRLAELKARRVVRGNAWYWILKDDYIPGEIFEI